MRRGGRCCIWPASFELSLGASISVAADQSPWKRSKWPPSAGSGISGDIAGFAIRDSANSGLSRLLPIGFVSWGAGSFAEKPAACVGVIREFADHMRSERGLSPRTIHPKPAPKVLRRALGEVDIDQIEAQRVRAFLDGNGPVTGAVLAPQAGCAAGLLPLCRCPRSTSPPRRCPRPGRNCRHRSSLTSTLETRSGGSSRRRPRASAYSGEDDR